MDPQTNYVLTVSALMLSHPVILKGSNHFPCSGHFWNHFPCQGHFWKFLRACAKMSTASESWDSLMQRGGANRMMSPCVGLASKPSSLSSMQKSIASPLLLSLVGSMM